MATQASSLDSTVLDSSKDTSGIGGHPRGLTTLFFTEMWERFSYYGMRALLILYMTTAGASGGLGFDTKNAASNHGGFTGSGYPKSIPGGRVRGQCVGDAASRFCGRRHHRARPLFDGRADDLHILHGAGVNRPWHRLAQAERERDRRRTLQPGGPAARRGLLDLLRRHQHRRLHRAARDQLSRREDRLASRLRRGGRRDDSRPDSVRRGPRTPRAGRRPAPADLGGDAAQDGNWRILYGRGQRGGGPPFLRPR